MSWNPDYTAVFAFRQKQLLLFRKNPEFITYAKAYYKHNPIEFICHWCDTYDPRNAADDSKLSRMPLILFDKQKDLVRFIVDMIEHGENGLVEKSRDMGASWVCCALSVWLWLFKDGAAIGWGSRKEQYVDAIGDPKSLLEKIRMTLSGIPKELLPKDFDMKRHASFMKIINPENQASITGEAGDNIGRGGRTLVYFKDESAHYEHPDLIEAALGDNTNVQIDISSVNGLGNVFHRKRESGIEWRKGHVAKNITNVFVMDWSDHPHKTQEWYDGRRAYAELNGALREFAQEVDRDYSAAVEGTIIPAQWVTAAIDAHVKLGFPATETWIGGLDVADGGSDRNALAMRKGSVLLGIREWGARDTGETARVAAAACVNKGKVELQYDCIGVGAGVKAESNRLYDAGDMPDGVRFIPWHAGATPLNPDRRVIDGDVDSPMNKDFYTNLKAQAWWDLRRRFEKTYNAVVNGALYNDDELISLHSKLPALKTLQKELSQPTASKNSRMKLLVDKTPDGTKSPNLADAVVMCYFPVTMPKSKSVRKPRLLR